MGTIWNSQATRRGGGKRRKKIGLTIEKKLHEVELVVDQAEIKCGTPAEEWDKARSGGRRSEKAPFSLSRTRTGPRHGEGLHRNVAATDSEYHTRVPIANTQRHDAINSLRAQAVRALNKLIAECDAGLTIQYQPFGLSVCMLLLQNGLSVGPVKSDDARSNGAQGMRPVINTINNGEDIESFVLHLAKEVHPQARNEDFDVSEI
ncbi:hypothetical protein HOY80DRAFT_890420 [Tuber brumale]|nr:hypothetical protein HOY80DRAFT_890420 [Tuber brumale]